MQTRGKVVVYLHPSFVSILSWINSKSGEREALGPYAIESVTAGPWKRTGGGVGGGQAELGEGALRRRLIITTVYLHNLMSPMNPSALFGRLLLTPT